MEDELEFKNAPRANLQTWDGLNKLIAISAVAIVIVLLLMAATLV